MALAPPKDLISAIRSDPANVTLWVGAGLSLSGVRQARRGLPSWEQLAEAMVEKISAKASTHPDLSLKSTAAHRAFKCGDFARVASIFKEQKVTTPGDFHDFLVEQLNPADIVTSRIHEIILATGFKTIITTNFDLVFENQTPRPLILSYPHCLTVGEALWTSGVVIKIHGSVEQSGVKSNIILSKRDMSRLVGKKSYQHLVTTIMMGGPVLCVGYSLRDRTLPRLLEQFAKVFGRQAPRVFALLPASERDAPTERDLPYQVQVIPFAKPTEDLLSFFGKLLALTRDKRPPTDVPLEGTPLPSPLKVKHVKEDAKAYYQAWRSHGGSHCAAFPQTTANRDRVRVTWRGWRHMTRVGISQAEICHRLSLLPYAREIIEGTQRGSARHERRLRSGVNYYGLTGTAPSRFRQPLKVKVIIEERPSLNEPIYTFLSVMEIRR